MRPNSQEIADSEPCQISKIEYFIKSPVELQYIQTPDIFKPFAYSQPNCVSCSLMYQLSLREKRPNTELFLVRIFLHSDCIRRDTSYLSVFSSNAGKYGPEVTPYLDTFHALYSLELLTYYFHCIHYSLSKVLPTPQLLIFSASLQYIQRFQ